jgi:hypothetical protein
MSSYPFMPSTCLLQCVEHRGTIHIPDINALGESASYAAVISEVTA